MTHRLWINKLCHHRDRTWNLGKESLFCFVPFWLRQGKQDPLEALTLVSFFSCHLLLTRGLFKRWTSIFSKPAILPLCFGVFLLPGQRNSQSLGFGGIGQSSTPFWKPWRDSETMSQNISLLSKEFQGGTPLEKKVIYSSKDLLYIFTLDFHFNFHSLRRASSFFLPLSWGYLWSSAGVVSFGYRIFWPKVWSKSWGIESRSVPST